MPDTLFLQFYSQRSSGIYNLLNGFSDSYDLCRRFGDFYWMPDEPDSSRWYQYEGYAQNPLPISQGTIYISALDVNHLYQSWVWSKEYPEIDFIVGGPVATERHSIHTGWNPAYIRVEDPEALPTNLTFTGKSVEEWFGVTDFSGRWHLDLPGDIPDGGRIYLSYTLDNTCFWSRCTYCNIGQHDRHRVRRRKAFNFEFKDLAFEGTKLVRLNTGSITPRQIRDLLPALPSGNGFEYRTFMRPSTAETTALREAIKRIDGVLPDMVLGFGVEFPTQRMLKHIDKGFTPQEMLEALELCRAHGIGVNGNLIVGWDNLTRKDLAEFEAFFDRIPVGSFKNMQLRWLFAHPYTVIHDHYHGEPVAFGPFYEGFGVALVDPDQIDLNRQAVEIIEHYAAAKEYTIEGLINVRAHLA